MGKRHHGCLFTCSPHRPALSHNDYLCIQNILIRRMGRREVWRSDGRQIGDKWTEEEGENQHLNCTTTQSTLQYRNCSLYGLVKTHGEGEKGEIIEFENKLIMCIRGLKKRNPLPFQHTSILFFSCSQRYMPSSATVCLTEQGLVLQVKESGPTSGSRSPNSCSKRFY